MLPHPVLFNLACSLFALGGFYLLAAAFKAGTRRVKWSGRAVGAMLLAIATALAVIGNPGLIDARFRPWLALYGDLKPGMTRAEIEAAIARHYPAADPVVPRPRVTIDSPQTLVFLMDPGSRSTNPDCEGIELTLADGRVIRKLYRPD